MQGFSLLFELVDGRSFSSPWYWIFLVWVWHAVTRAPLGVPRALLRQMTAQGASETAAQDLDRHLERHVAEWLQLLRRQGLGLVAGLSALLTALGVMAGRWGVEFAQASLCLLLPLTLLAALRLRLLLRLGRTGTDRATRLAMVLQHLDHTQALAAIAVLLTALIGMVHTLRHSVFLWP